MSFLDNRAHWLDLLRGSGTTAISRQLTNACRDAAFFELVHELGKRAREGDRPNGRILELFQLGYLFRQLLCIRRLVDETKNVNSLWHLVRKMKTKRTLLTRQNYVTMGGLPFDPHAARAAFERSYETETDGSPHLLQQWLDCDRRHDDFDFVSIKGRLGRNDPSDRVNPVVFDRLESALAAPCIRRVRSTVNRYVAHSATPAAGGSSEMRATYADIRDSLKVIARVHAFINGPLLGESITNVVPYPQGNHLEHLEWPLVPPTESHNARATWREKVAAIEAWVHGDGALGEFYPRPK